ncbi:MAG: hypothetical protein Q7T11_08840 [Deltaproteobacteria bacterium]|nr:hypothetical protein [Deltaproteobacteria bacterium]
MRNLVLFTFISLLISSPIAQALLVKQMTLRQVTHSSERIFRGTVLDSSLENDAEESGRIVRYFTFRVDECLKGACGSKITFKQWAGGERLPEYDVGKDYLIFLPEESRRTGLVAPVGIMQGVYPLTRSQGRFLIRNGTVPDQDYESLKTEVLQYVREGK